MNNKDTKETNVLAQASILMVAGIITRIIGVLYRSPLTSVIGDEGNGYYGIAVNIYTMILLVSSYSIPMAVSKVVSSKLAVHQYRNAHKVFKCALMYVLVVGRNCQSHYILWRFHINSFESAKSNSCS